MVQTLEYFSPRNLSMLLSLVIVAWLIWPVVCGLLGARKGQALQGAAHGLFWGPIGLFIVLFSKPKHVCPTCGRRTLREPAHRVPHALVLPRVSSGAGGIDPTGATRPAPPPVIAQGVKGAPFDSRAERPVPRAILLAPDDATARLHASVNGC